jgi:hypothetical protein
MTADAFRWYRWLEAVNKRSDIRSATPRVAIGLACRANNKTGRCHPGEEWLMRNCAVGRRTVTYAIADLRRIGALLVLKPGGWRRRAEYELVPAENWLVGRTDVRTTDGVVVRTDRHLQGAQIDTHRAHPRAHLTTKELSTSTTAAPPPDGRYVADRDPDVTAGPETPHASVRPAADDVSTSGQKQRRQQQDGGGGGEHLPDNGEDADPPVMSWKDVRNAIRGRGPSGLRKFKIDPPPWESSR